MAASDLARTRLTFVSPGGTALRGAVVIAAPTRVRDGGWECRVALEGLTGNLVPIMGEDALQALSLALTFVGRELRQFIAAGGTLQDAEGAPWPLAAYFPTA